MTNTAKGAGIRSGFALAELLLGLAVTAVVGLVAATTISLAVPTWLNQANRAEAVITMTDAADFILRDLRTAGFNAGEGDFRGLTSAEPAAFELVADLDRDGLLDTSSQERIRYRVGSQGKKLMRVVGDQPMALLDGLEPGGFTVRYFDAVGTEIAGPFPLSADLLDAVSRMEVEIVAEIPGSGGPLAVTVVALLRNR